MSTLGELGRRVWMLAHRRQADRDLDEEMRLHQALLAGRRGESPTSRSAEPLASTREFGSPLRIREDAHEALGWRAIEDAVRDARFGVRTLVADKPFALAAIATLALGIGATTAIFSLVHGVVFKSLPFAEPERLVQMYGTPSIRGEAVGGLATIRSQSQSFDALVGYNVSARYLRSADGPARAMIVSAERDFFSMLGVQPLEGRGFRHDDPATVAVISEQFWKRAMGGRASAIGETLEFNDAPLTVIGIMPDSFQFPYGAASVLHSVAPQARTDLWIPFDPPADPVLRGGRFGYVTGRLRHEVSLQQAENELAVLTNRMAVEDPGAYAGRGVRLASLSDAVVAPPVRRSLFALLGFVAVVLILAVVNGANLWFVRMTVRGKEIAARIALGAGPRRLARQFLTESIVLSLLGGIVALAVAWWGTRWLAALMAAELPRVDHVGIDRRVFGFLLVVCISVGILIAFMPVAFVRRVAAQEILQSGGGRSTIGGRLRLLRDGLVVVEIALALVLLTGAGTLVRELLRLRQTDTGMVTNNVITFHLLEHPPGLGIVRRGPPLETETRPFYEIADRVRQIPGVRDAGFTQVLPLQNWGWSANSIDFNVRGRPPLEAPPFSFDLRYVTPGYFDALGVPLLRGRGFTTSDTRDSPPVIIINATFARRVFRSEENPVGQTTTRGTVVGVVADIKNANLDQETLPELYYPIAQNWSQLSELGMTLVVRTAGPPSTIVEAVRRAVRAVNPDEAIFDVKTMDSIVSESMASFTVYLMLMIVFAGQALALALTGTYGVMASVAASRAREFAIRVSLGASRAAIMRLVVRQGLFLTASGLAIGLMLAWLTTPVLRALPVNARPPGIAVLLPVAALLTLAATLACLIPARRASHVDPMTILRNE
ncbi:MAG TPA: ABC transporter permease [Vicinamibacterales bacterium]